MKNKDNNLIDSMSDRTKEQIILKEALKIKI